MAEVRNCKVLVVGAGPGGYVAAIRAGQLGLDTVIVEVANPGHPYGVRGVGETNIVPPPAAIANALYDASGIRMNVLPMSPAIVMENLLNNS